MGFLFINLNRGLGWSTLGTYREILFFSDKLLKKYLTILSSNELKVTTAKIPFLFKALDAAINP